MKKLRIALRKFEPFAESIQRQLQDFQKQLQEEVEFEVVSLELDDLYRELITEEGLKSGKWDLALVVSDWLAEAQASDALLDLNTCFDAYGKPEGFPEAWPESLLRLQQFDQQVLGLPYHDGPECLIYRKDLLEKFGLEVPTNWDEFHQQARLLSSPGQNRWGTVLAGFPDGHNTVYDFCLQLWTRGGELFAEDGSLDLESGPATEALDYYRKLMNDSDATHPGSREFDSVKAGLAFVQGEVAMMINWFGFAVLAETDPSSKTKGKVGIAPLPSARGASSASLNVYWIMGIGSGSKHAELAYRFLCHCTDAENDKLLTFKGGTGCRKSTWHDPEVNAAIPFYNKLESIHNYARELPRRTDWASIAHKIDQKVMDA